MTPKTVYMSDSLPSSFFDRPTLEVAPQLLGQILVRRFDDGRVFRGVISEVEAYTADDPACHAFGGKKRRCEVMFGPAGHAYVYFIYGMYHCLNVVTEPDGTPGAILIRGLSNGCEDSRQVSGPGRLCRFLDIDLSFNGLPLFSDNELLSIAPGKTPAKIFATPRIGISKAIERLWRFTSDEPKRKR